MKLSISFSNDLELLDCINSNYGFDDSDAPLCQHIFCVFADGTFIKHLFDCLIAFMYNAQGSQIKQDFLSPWILNAAGDTRKTTKSHTSSKHAKAVMPACKNQTNLILPVMQRLDLQISKDFSTNILHWGSTKQKPVLGSTAKKAKVS